jgi:hypothetical protein
VKLFFVVLTLLAVLSGCASTAPTSIGGDTYYAAKTNTAGAFGDPGAIAGKLMADGSKFCATKGREFELVTQTISPSRVASSLGGASITFKCVEHANNPLMRPDNGVTTITH